MKEFFQSLLSPTGEVSSKRFVGMISMMVALICILFLTWTEGGSNTVEALLQTTLVISASLLGISSVTGIWKNKKGTK